MARKKGSDVTGRVIHRDPSTKLGCEVYTETIFPCMAILLSDAHPISNFCYQSNHIGVIFTQGGNAIVPSQQIQHQCTRWYSIGSNPFWYSLYTSIHPIMFFVFHCYRSNNLTQNQCTYNTDSIGTKPGCTAATSPTPMYVQTISNEIELTLMFTNTNMYLVSYLYSQ